MLTRMAIAALTMGAAAHGAAPGTLFASANAEPDVLVIPIKLPKIPVGVVTFPNGKVMNLKVGIGSGAFHAAGDAPNRVWLITDRGPRIDCQLSKEMIGLDVAETCAGDVRGKIFPLPGFAPTIYGVDLGADNVARLTVTLPLKGKSGKPVTGLPNLLTVAPTVTAFDITGKPLNPDPSGLETKSLAKLADGSFWVADGYAPSLAEVGADGTVLKRLVPSGTAGDFSEADYAVEDTLPAILAKRRANRGIEAIALTPDEAALYVMTQSPLEVPDETAFRNSSTLRLFKVDRKTGAASSEYVYQLDPPDTFRSDSAKKLRRQSDVRLSEMIALSADVLLVAERIDRTTKVYRVNLAGAGLVPAALDDPNSLPSLEQLSPETMASRSLRPAEKTLVFDSDDIPGLPRKIEGLAVMSEREMVIVTDNDFGMEGGDAKMLRLIFNSPKFK